MPRHAASCVPVENGPKQTLTVSMISIGRTQSRRYVVMETSIRGEDINPLVYRALLPCKYGDNRQPPRPGAFRQEYPTDL
jgi:hypothetical protein